MNDRKLAEAARWQIRLEDGADASAPSAFERWLSADKENAAAYKAVQNGYQAFSEAFADESFRRTAQDALKSAKRRRTRRTYAAKLGMLTFLIISASFFGIQVKNRFGLPGQQPPRSILLASLPAQHRQFTLSDGSIIMLDGGSSLLVSFGEDERFLALESGQARFRVAHDTSRPFKVKAGDRIIVATGTDFNVARVEHHLTVTLVAGAVRVERQCHTSVPNCDRPVIHLTPGQRVDGIEGEPDVTLSRVDTKEALAWLSGRLVARNIPLYLVADHLNRNSIKKLHVNPSVAELRVSGVFDLGDAAALADALERLLPVSVKKDGNGFAISALQH